VTKPYRSPAWLIGGNAQTIWPALYSQVAASPHPKAYQPRYVRERWTAPDGDFVDIDFAPSGTPDKPFLVLFHGLEGSSRSHYARAFAAWCEAHDFGYAVPHFRGCSGEINHAPRAYHSGDFEEIGWILQRVRERLDAQSSAARTLYSVGVSLGGNALLRWAEEQGNAAAQVASGVVAISSPVDLAASGAAIGTGFNRQTYTRMFLRSMKPRALKKLAQFPGLFDRSKMLAARDLYEFDNVVTAPLHGFKNTEDYWARASAKPHLHAIKIPALVMNAINDPFVPAACLPRQTEVGTHVLLDQPAHGGHVGFARGGFPGLVDYLPERVNRFFSTGT
jgi:uncharacterized protein